MVFDLLFLLRDSKNDLLIQFCSVIFPPPCLSNFLQQSDLCSFLSVQTLQVGAGGGGGGGENSRIKWTGYSSYLSGLIKKAVLGVPFKISDEVEHRKR